MKKISILFIFCSLFSEDISLFEEKETATFNEKLILLRNELKEACTKTIEKTVEGEEELKKHFVKVQSLKKEIQSLEEKWKAQRIEDVKDEEAVYWDQGDTTIADLVMEYGSSDYLYIIPKEVGSIKVTLQSQIPLPYEAWDDMIQLILSQNGVGVEKINTFCKQLYIMKNNIGQVEVIATEKDQLLGIADTSRVFYLFSPPPEKLKSCQLFLERFSDPKQTQIHAIGSKISIIAPCQTVSKLVDLYTAVVEQEDGRKIETHSLTKLSVQEGEKILQEFFLESVGKGHATFFKSQSQGLKVMPLERESSLILMGPSRMIDRARSILDEVENKLKDPDEMTIFWYTCKHSDPEDLAGVLEQVYNSLIQTPFGGENSEKKEEKKTNLEVKCNNDRCYKKEPPFTPVNPVTPPKVSPSVYDKKEEPSYGNFIVDSKTGSILMVVRLNQLDRLKQVLERLDVPKKMVHIDVLLVERRIQDHRKAGVNILKIGSAASNTRQSAISFDTNLKAMNRGLLEFIMSRPKGDYPAFDLTYQFLLTQEDLQVNSNPSVTAINNTPALIALVDQISINNGAVPIDTPAGGVAVEKSYTRAEYGITINLTPVIHQAQGEKGFVTLQTNITFDTPGMSLDDRPPVARRHIQNEVRIADGETVVIGGLRQKSLENKREKVPFLGDIPGFGKLFGMNNQDERNTEMIFFITPHIIQDPIEDLRCVRRMQVMRRPGDIPEFLEELKLAKDKEKTMLLEKSMSLLWDKL